MGTGRVVPTRGSQAPILGSSAAVPARSGLWEPVRGTDGSSRSPGRDRARSAPSQRRESAVDVVDPVMKDHREPERLFEQLTRAELAERLKAAAEL